MASDRRISANRRNAQMSTGPRSADGRARSAQNAVTHGLTARRALLADENAAEFEKFRDEMQRHFCPAGAIEAQLVERATCLIWRLRRIPAFEVALCNWTVRENEKNDIKKERFTVQPEWPDHLVEEDENSRLGYMVNSLLRRDLLSKLNRYESSLQKQLTLTLKELRETGANRVVEHVQEENKQE